MFGEKLRAERKKRGTTVQTVANKSGVSRSYITLIENGKRLPGKKSLSKIAFALDLKPTTVLNWYLQDISKKMQKDLETT